MPAPYASDFAVSEGTAWLNAAHQGALPRVAAAAAHEAVSWKLDPRRLTTARFNGVPRQLKQLLAGLIHAREEDLFLANGASWGLHLLANGIPLGSGDEVLLMGGDFPSNVLPWLGLRDRGVEVRLLRPQDEVLRPDEVERALTRATRVLCLSWVHSFSGCVVDIDSIGRLCRRRGVRFVANVTQGLGARPFDVSRTTVDALVCAGWKWLCGPYATGFGWLRPELAGELRYNQRYWLSLQTADDLGSEDDGPPPADRTDAGRYDLFGTANFFNFVPWCAALDYLLGQGIDAVAAHDARLVRRLIDGLDPERYRLVGPREGPLRSTLVVIAHRDGARNRRIHDRCREAQIYVAYRRGRLRVAPHLYNTDEDVDRLLAVLDEAR